MPCRENSSLLIYSIGEHLARSCVLCTGLTVPCWLWPRGIRKTKGDQLSRLFSRLSAKKTQTQCLYTYTINRWMKSDQVTYLLQWNGGKKGRSAHGTSIVPIANGGLSSTAVQETKSCRGKLHIRVTTVKIEISGFRPRVLLSGRHIAYPANRSVSHLRDNYNRSKEERTERKTGNQGRDQKRTGFDNTTSPCYVKPRGDEGDIGKIEDLSSVRQSHGPEFRGWTKDMDEALSAARTDL